MTIFEYLDDTYCNHAQHRESLKDHGRASAAAFLMNSIKSFHKWTGVPVLLTKFTLYKCGLIAAPLNPIKEQMKLIQAQAAKKAQEIQNDTQEGSVSNDEEVTGSATLTVV